MQGALRGHARAIDEACNLRLRVRMQRQRMAFAHVAQTRDQHPDHFTAPDVMPRINWREKIA